MTVSRSAEAHLLALPPDPSLARGARNALASALRLKAGDSLVLLVERSREAIGASFLREAHDLSLETRTYIVDPKQAQSPAFVNRLAIHLKDAAGSVLVASSSLDAEFRRRICIHDDARRHAHMVGVTEAMMRQSMRVDYAEVHALGERLIERLGASRTVHVTTGPRTTLTMELGEQLRWHNGSGVLTAPGFTNLPGGEVFTCPQRVDGAFRADGGVWTPTGRMHGLTIEVERGRVVRGPKELMEPLENHANGTRIGQIALGTNIGVLTPIGAMLQDLKMPGFHLIIGYSCPELTGATWDSDVMVPVLCRRPDVYLDGEPVMIRGRYSRDLLR
ncbi:MAG: aminopeptidase [Myxococcota bacterium]